MQSKRFLVEAGQIINGLEFIEYAGSDNSRNSLGKFLCVCGEEFVTRIRHVRIGKTKSCGCLKGLFVGDALRKHSPIQYILGTTIMKLPILNNIDKNRFWSKVAFTANPDKCWDWSGAHNRYGYFRIGKSMYRSNRMAYLLHYGKDPEKLHVIHSCDNPMCCNPAHLSLGTHYDNMQDKANKGRAKNGSTINIIGNK